MKHARPAFWLSPRGVWMLLGLCVVLALSSVVPIAGVLLVVLSALAIGLVVADLRLGPAASELELQRRPLAHVSVDVPAYLEYELVNRCASTVKVAFAEAPVADVSFRDDVTAVSAAPRSRSVLRSKFVAHERGLVRFDGVYARVEGPIGVLRRRFMLEAPLDVRVYPDFSAVEGYGTLARRSTLLETGLRKLRLRGAGSEFESLREYEPGDAFRTVNWKATAHRGRLMVAQFDVERSQNIIIALDAGRLMVPRIGTRRKFDYALTAALSVARVAQLAGDNVGLVAFSSRTLLHVAPRRGFAHHAALVRAAYALQPRLEEPDYESLAADLKRRYAKRSLVIVFTDLFDPAASAAVLGSLALLAPRHLVVCVLMNDSTVADALARIPRDGRDAYRAAVAMMLESERSEAVGRLRARGILVVDAAAQRLTVALLDAYLDVKGRGLL